ncbi:MAG: UDP-N-acetylmuramate dehydrogenase [Bryobacteraceae bacterium]|nr:UDP-N-acetylmuramate dehydrogenase [Bryobacterales bacterium]MEB2363834.1 UDP-N-acetylmuramate dehydrogenase [Bryobacterales bacterium]NUN02704.1 UDP-N-acetylmuramate dehydrogenase [Bryobacteraceae bacterium]
MPVESTRRTAEALSAIPGLEVAEGMPLACHTRFGIGGPADVFGETAGIESFVSALRFVRSAGLDFVVIGGGTNLIVSDEGYRGVVLRFRGGLLEARETHVYAEAGAELQQLVDFTIAHGLKGLETLSGIPGSVGAAIYGNAGAYGHSISERVRRVRFTDGDQLLEFENSQCEFRYRESVFKRHKSWIVLSVDLELDAADAVELRATADEILKIRNEKFPPTMKCAGSIFKNLLAANLPPAVRERVPQSVIREGKIPAAHFLEQAGAKGLSKGDIHVATYHANLVYNAGNGTARDLCALIAELKRRVFELFGLELEEEVQYVGF